MTYILGINSYHADAAAALIHDGKILFAIEEERLNRVKHSAGFPEKAIKCCLKKTGLSIKDIDHIAINSSPKSHLFKKIIFTIKNRPNPLFILNKIKLKIKRNSFESQLIDLLNEFKLTSKLHFVEHHLAHLASAFYPSPFKSSAVLSVDGFGDFASSAWGLGIDNTININKQIFFPHSLGIFYTAITQFLGFPNYGDEYKVMGLAPYGNNCFEEEISNLLYLKEKGEFQLNLDYFNHTKNWKDQKWEKLCPKIEIQYNEKIINLLGSPRKPNEPINQRHKDIAKSTQIAYEKAFFHILNNLYSETGLKNLSLAGGCAANSVANGKITKATPFEKVYVQAAPGDAGGAIGAALVIWHKLGGKRSEEMKNAYLGIKSSNNEIRKLLSKKYIIETLKNKKCNIKEYQNSKNLIKKVTNEIINGKVIGWFEGEMEWGPRALGHRSIIADPRNINMKEILNSKIKKRESFRPFAPSILKEEIPNWFELTNESDSDVPFMMKVYPIKENKRVLIPSVCHVDGSGRLQSITKDKNGRYYDLIKVFFEKTGIPILINTSFNENEPIVSSPKEALDCFLRTKMDILVLENFLISRN